MTGRSASATTSRMMWIASASRRWRCVSFGPTPAIARCLFSVLDHQSMSRLMTF